MGIYHDVYFFDTESFVSKLLRYKEYILDEKKKDFACDIIRDSLRKNTMVLNKFYDRYGGWDFDSINNELDNYYRDFFILNMIYEEISLIENKEMGLGNNYNELIRELLLLDIPRNNFNSIIYGYSFNELNLITDMDSIFNQFEIHSHNGRIGFIPHDKLNTCLDSINYLISISNNHYLPILKDIFMKAMQYQRDMCMIISG